MNSEEVIYRRGTMGEIILKGYDKNRLDDFLMLFYNTVHTVNARDYSEVQLDAWAPQKPDRQRWGKNLENSFVAAAFNGDDVLLGYGTLCGENEFDLLYIHKDFQRNGIASLLADKVENEAKRRGAGAVFTEASITAKPFFEKRGYRVVKEQRKPLRGEVFINYVMQKELANGGKDIQYENYYNIFPVSIHDLRKTSVGADFSAPLHSVGDVDVEKEKAIHRPEYYQVINAAGELLGAFELREISHGACRAYMCIDKQWRGKGMAAEFAAHMALFAVEKKGYSGVTVLLDKEHEPLKRTFKTAGFEEDGAEKNRMVFKKKK